MAMVRPVSRRTLELSTSPFSACCHSGVESLPSRFSASSALLNGFLMIAAYCRCRSSSLLPSCPCRGRIASRRGNPETKRAAWVVDTADPEKVWYDRRTTSSQLGALGERVWRTTRKHMGLWRVLVAARIHTLLILDVERRRHRDDRAVPRDAASAFAATWPYRHPEGRIILPHDDT